MAAPKEKIDFRKLYRLAGSEWKMLAIGTVFLAISSATLLIFPQVIKTIIDEALISKDAKTINQVALMALGLFAVQSFAGAMRYYFFTITGERIVLSIRKKLFHHLLFQDISFFDGQKVGELQSRLSSDATILQNTLSVNISMLVRNSATAVGGLAMLLYTSPTLGFSLLGAIPPIAAGIAVFGQKIRKISRAQQDAIAVASGVANETLSGVRIVRALGKEAYESARYSERLEESFSVARKKITIIGIFIAFASMLGLAAVTGVLWYGSLLVIDGTFTVGSLTSFMLYTLSVAVAAGSLGGLWTDFMSAFGASRRIFEILDHPIGKTMTGTSPITSINGTVEFKNVTFSYPTRPDVTVLDNINFKILPGEAVALVGPSGGGKSTIASLIARFYDPDKGEVTIDGNSLSNIDPKNFRANLAIVPQDPTLFSISIADNISFGELNVPIEKIKAAAKLANAEHFINSFPETYATLIGERGVQLSGGQRQRIAIARAALRDPRILILDEATSALDAESEGLVQEALERLMQGRTTLVIAHRLSTVRKANRILVIDGGRIVQSGTHEELLRQEAGIYRKLVEKQLAHD